MKLLITTFLLATSFPVYAFERIGYRSNHEVYESHKGFAYEKKCFRYVYREQYIPGNSMSPGYVKSYNEKVSIPCYGRRKVFNYHHHKIEPQTGSTMLGGLIGGGIAASLSKSDAYSWSIPLGAVLGAGIGNNECK